MAEDGGDEFVFTESAAQGEIRLASERISKDPLVVLVKDVRARVHAGDGKAVLAEAERGGNDAKWILAKGWATLGMGNAAEAREIAEQAAAKFESDANLKGQSLALQLLVDCHLSLHECAEVLDASMEATAICWQLEDKAAEAAMLHSCASAFHLQWRYPEAMRAASRAAVLFAEAGDKLGEGIALQTAASANDIICQKQGESGTASIDKDLMREIMGPVGGQGEMDAVRFGKTSVMYDEKMWQPISKFHPVLLQRQSLVGAKKEHIMPTVYGAKKGAQPLYKPKQFGWGKPASKLDNAWWQMVLQAGDKVV